MNRKTGAQAEHLCGFWLRFFFAGADRGCFKVFPVYARRPGIRFLFLPCELSDRLFPFYDEKNPRAPWENAIQQARYCAI